LAKCAGRRSKREKPVRYGKQAEVWMMGTYFHPAGREAARQGAEAEALLPGDPVCRADPLQGKAPFRGQAAVRMDAIRADAIRADAVRPYGWGRREQSATKGNKHRRGATALDSPGEILIMINRDWRF
jgi:hypothetical protein